MSTRAQLTVVEGSGEEEWQRVTLYHHCDGYPEHIVEEDIPQALRLLRDSTSWPQDNPWPWEAGRAGKVAAYLCAAHPAGFEPQAYHDLHGDIDYYYRLYLAPTWELEVYEPTKAFWDEPCLGNMRLIRPRTPIQRWAG